MCDSLSRLKPLRNSVFLTPPPLAAPAVAANECHGDGIQSPEAKGWSLKSPAGLVSQVPARAGGQGLPDR